MIESPPPLLLSSDGPKYKEGAQKTWASACKEGAWRIVQTTRLTKIGMQTGRLFAAAAASAIVGRKTIKVRGRKWSGRSAKNDAKYGRTDSNNRWRLTSLNDVIFQPMRSLDFFITNHVIITRLKLSTTN